MTVAPSGQPIAIVGIGLRFPGGATDAESYWRMLCEGTDAIREVPADRFDVRRFYDAKPATPGRMMTRWGGYLDGLDHFDCGFFDMSPREAERLNPEQRLLCEIAWEALEDAGVDAARVRGSRTGVFVGQWVSDFEARLFADPELVDFYMTMGSGRYASSGRLSYIFDLRGPSVTLDTACSSSLVAVHLASKSLQSGESELAIAGGVNVILQPHVAIAYSQSRMMATDGRCKFGDERADGYVRSEGAGLVVLKTLERALADGDRIYAVVRGSAQSNDGKSSGSMGTVSKPGQTELLRTAYRDAGVRPSEVAYVEAHGTGTQVGDTVELASLGAVFGEERAAGQRVYVGSVKTNLGHTEGAAGIAGLIKTTLAVHHGRIPPSLHFVTPNPKIPWDTLSLEIPRAEIGFPAGGSRIAGVNGFGISGSNAHVVLAEAPERAAAPSRSIRATRLLPLSARTPEALAALASRYAERLERKPELELDDICFGAATRRTSLEHRAAFTAKDRASLIEALRNFTAGAPASAQGQASSERPKLVFVVSGQGSQWVGMGRALAAEEPVFRAELERCNQAITKYADFDVMEQLAAERGSAAYRGDDVVVIQPVLFALQMAYAALWRSLGVEPDAVVGHSLGEAAAAAIAGAIDLDTAAKMMCWRSALMRRTAGQGAMALLELSVDETRALLERYGERVSIGCINGPTSTVISGDPGPVQEIVAEVERAQRFSRLVKSDVASHSPQMEAAARELAQKLAGMQARSGSVAFYSTVLGERVDGTALDPSYWARNLRDTVRFDPAIRKLLEDGAELFLELSPHPLLVPSIQETARAVRREVVALGSSRRGDPEQATLLGALGGLWARGWPVDFGRLFESGRAVSLPLYPFQRERHWIGLAEARPASAGQARQKPPDDTALGYLHRFAWDEVPLAEGGGQSPVNAWLVLAADGERAQCFADALAAQGDAAVVAPLSEVERAVAELRQRPQPCGVLLLLHDEPGVAYQPVAVARALAGAGARLWIVTSGAQAVTGSEPRIAVDQAAAWGSGRAIAQESPELWGGLFDLERSASDSDSAKLLARALFQPDGEEQVAFRGGLRFGLRLRKAPSLPAPEFAWRPDGALLVSGGLGEIALHVARAAVGAGVRRLILLGRTPLPERGAWLNLDPATPAGRRVQAVRELEALGASVQTAAVDVGNEAELRAFLDRYEKEAWPPIRGVVHTAAVLESRLVLDTDRESFDKVLHPKLAGAQNLDRLLPELDLFLMFSSIIGQLGEAGEANYAAANAALDALAQDRKARGLPGVSIAWGVWEDTGLARGQVESGLSRQGIVAFAPERACSIVLWSWAGSVPAFTVLGVDWAAFRQARAGRGERLYRELLPAHGGSRGEADLATELASASVADRKRLIEALVRDSIGKVLKVPPAKIDAKRTLGSMGLSSILAIELRNLLERGLNRSLSASLAWNYPTLTAMVDYLAGQLEPAAEPAGAPRAEATAPEDLSQIAELSDEEALLALRGGSA